MKKDTIHFSKRILKGAKKSCFLSNSKYNSLGLKGLISLFLILGIFQPQKILAIENRKKPPGIEFLERLPKNDYILGQGDRIRIVISRQIPEITNIYTIDSSGTIYLPFVDRVYISGLTIYELNNILNKKFKEYVIDPNVQVEVITYRPVRVYIDGEVETPGLYTLSQGRNETKTLNNPGRSKYFSDYQIKTRTNSSISKKEKKPFIAGSKFVSFPTLFDALQLADGITIYSDLSRIEITRINNISSGGKLIRTYINFLDFITKGDSSQNIRIYDGDIIKISKSKVQLTQQISQAIRTNLNPKYFSVFVSGRVESPGIVKVSKNSTLNDAIELSGGIKALRGKVHFIRFDNDGTLDKRKIGYNERNKRGSFKNPFLKSGDIIRVGKSGLNIATEIINEVTAPFIGIYSTINVYEKLSE